MICLLFFIEGCITYQKYDGFPIQYNPDEIITLGYTTKTETLDHFGPPQKIFNNHDGYLFIYEYNLKERNVFFLGDLFITGIFLFEYDRSAQKRDALAILFDHDDHVISYAFEKQI